MLNSIRRSVHEFVFRKIDQYYNQKFSTKNKWGINISDTSWFDLPLEISGGNNVSIGRFSSIGKYAWIGAFEKYLAHDEFHPRIEIGDNVRIGNYACIVSINSIKIKDGVLISEYFYVSDHSHGYSIEANIPPAYQPLEAKGEGVVIGENSFIGYRVTILPGVSIGRNCIIGSHSVVTKSFPDYSMIAGVPAKLIKKYDFALKEWVTIKSDKYD
ncbi:acyltransferase [Hymenobacter sp. BT188]|uniref:acyltransferase n=1 Tax=Hymenobacter sp. BT188 TaxID=2763504 RepID=UPI001650DC1E|nr:acyltransferase [Hymenobacter sp. BT188]MBC6607158.1 acyltransferase [Hymenobacter sp. BT188]